MKSLDPHTWVRRQLAAFRMGLLDDADNRRIEAHLDECEPCRSMLVEFDAAAVLQDADSHIPAFMLSSWPARAAELSGLERELTLSHLQTCEVCQEDLRSLGFDPVLPALERSPARASGPGVARVISIQRSRPLFLQARIQQWGLAAAAVILLVVGVRQFRPETMPSVTNRFPDRPVASSVPEQGAPIDKQPPVDRGGQGERGTAGATKSDHKEAPQEPVEVTRQVAGRPSASSVPDKAVRIETQPRVETEGQSGTATSAASDRKEGVEAPSIVPTVDIAMQSATRSQEDKPLGAPAKRTGGFLGGLALRGVTSGRDTFQVPPGLIRLRLTLPGVLIDDEAQATTMVTAEFVGPGDRVFATFGPRPLRDFARPSTTIETTTSESLLDGAYRLELVFPDGRRIPCGRGLMIRVTG